MEIFTRADAKRRAAQAAKVWKQWHYHESKGWHRVTRLVTHRGAPARVPLSAELIYDQLVALGPDPEPEQVDEIIGNASYTSYPCDQCKKWKLPLALIDAGYEVGDPHIALCRDCLLKMAEELAQH